MLFWKKGAYNTKNILFAYNMARRKSHLQKKPKRQSQQRRRVSRKSQRRRVSRKVLAATTAIPIVAGFLYSRMQQKPIVKKSPISENNYSEQIQLTIIDAANKKIEILIPLSANKYETKLDNVLFDFSNDAETSIEIKSEQSRNYITVVIYDVANQSIQVKLWLTKSKKYRATFIDVIFQ